MMPPIAKELEQNQSRAEHDRGISEIEGVPVMRADVKIDEVGDAAPRHAIEHIARRTSKNQRDSRLPQAPARPARGQKPEQETRLPRPKIE